MDLVKIFLSIIGLFCIFLTISGYSLRNKSLINSTTNEKILMDSPSLSEKQGILVCDDSDPNDYKSQLISEKNPLRLIMKTHTMFLLLRKRKKEIPELTKEEEEKFTDEKLEQLYNTISDEERKNVTDNDAFSGRVFHFMGNIFGPLQNFREIKQKLKHRNTDLSKEILKKADELKKGYHKSAKKFVKLLFDVKNDQITLSYLYLEKKGINCILSVKMKIKKEMKKNFEEIIENIYQHYLKFIKDISSLLKESVLLNDKMFSIHKEVLSAVNNKDFKKEIETLIFNLISQVVYAQDSMVVILKNIKFKFNDGFVLFENYYKLCKEKHKENELSDELFNLCEKNYNHISKLIDDVNSEWKKTISRNNETLSEEILFFKKKGVNFNKK
ncbi:hypothetical protein TUBRATIS_15260 [Tubulinosema ratisbonensis]|uniref:Uncharacterized protein n=1 Tax=Tubulinosema ratisbonensis TaxID=291195 RepID=A0A437ALD3_9MICR|nr:hypothetical protein TUBRATIS_15260 [Tubulinosema ratisbonensis]